MVALSRQLPQPGRSAEPVFPSRLQPDSFSFRIGGSRFVAIDKRALERSDELAEHLTGGASAVGRIAVAEADYLIFSEAEGRGDGCGSAAELLTRRELQVAMLVADGRCDKEIARKLGISTYTVREHIRRIFAKLNVCRRSAILARILR